MGPTDLQLQMRIRVAHAGGLVLGPGRAELLARIRDTSSIAQAARDMEMSYMKAWKLVKSLNESFRVAAVEVRRGGAAGGEAHLTPIGESALALYERMDRLAQAAAAELKPDLATLFAPQSVTHD